MGPVLKQIRRLHQEDDIIRNGQKEQELQSGDNFLTLKEAVILRLLSSIGNSRTVRSKCWWPSAPSSGYTSLANAGPPRKSDPSPSALTYIHFLRQNTLIILRRESLSVLPLDRALRKVVGPHGDYFIDCREGTVALGIGVSLVESAILDLEGPHLPLLDRFAFNVVPVLPRGH
jgi:hypothetical protein